MNTQGSTTSAVEIMNKKRKFHEPIIEKQKKKDQHKQHLESIEEPKTDYQFLDEPLPTIKKNDRNENTRPKKKQKTFVDEEFFISSQSSTNSFSEKGYGSP